MDFDFIYIKSSAIKLWIALMLTFYTFYIMSEHFSKTLGGIFQKPGWTPNAGWDFPKAWVEFSASPPRHWSVALGPSSLSYWWLGGVGHWVPLLCHTDNKEEWDIWSLFSVILITRRSGTLGPSSLSYWCLGGVGHWVPLLCHTDDKEEWDIWSLFSVILMTRRSVALGPSSLSYWWLGGVWRWVPLLWHTDD